MPEIPPTPPQPDRSREALEAVGAEMEREDRELVFPLLDRLLEVAEALGAGRPIDPEYLASGFKVWHEYIAELHQQRLGWLGAIVEAAPSVYGSGRRRAGRLRAAWERWIHRSKTVAPAAGPSLGAAYADILGTQTRMAQRIAALEDLVVHYRRREFYTDQMLASLVRSGAFSDRAWAKYEEGFVLRTLDEHLPEDAARWLLDRLVASAASLDRWRAAVRAFLDRPIVDRPAGAGAAAQADAPSTA